MRNHFLRCKGVPSTNDPYCTDTLPVTDGLTARLDAKYWAEQGATSYATKTNIRSYIVDTSTYPTGGYVGNRNDSGTNDRNAQGHTQTIDGYPFLWFPDSTINNNMQEAIIMTDAWSNATSATYGHTNGNFTMFLAGRYLGQSGASGFKRFATVINSGGSSLGNVTMLSISYNDVMLFWRSYGPDMLMVTHHSGWGTGAYDWDLHQTNTYNIAPRKRDIMSWSIERTPASGTDGLKHRISSWRDGESGDPVMDTGTSGFSGTIGNSPHTSGFQTPDAAYPDTAKQRFLVVLNDQTYPRDIWFHIGEVAIYNKYLSDADHNSVRSHLATKWGVS